MYKPELKPTLIARRIILREWLDHNFSAIAHIWEEGACDKLMQQALRAMSAEMAIDVVGEAKAEATATIVATAAARAVVTTYWYLGDK